LPVTIAGLSGGQLSILHEEPLFVLARWKNVAIAVWGTQGTLPHVRQLERFSDELIADSPKGISAVHVVVNAAPLPDSTTRAEMNRLTDKYAKSLACMATVVEGSGFWASAMHSFITSIHWVARRPFKVRISSTIADGTSWMPTPHWERTGTRLAGAELTRHVMSVRERVKSG
jgi:hypothetical protein